MFKFKAGTSKKTGGSSNEEPGPSTSFSSSAVEEIELADIPPLLPPRQYTNLQQEKEEVKESVEPTVDPKPPVVVVSHQLAFLLKRSETGSLYRSYSSAAMIVALAPLVVESKGFWVGWPGLYDFHKAETVPEARDGDDTPAAALPSNQTMPVRVEYKDFTGYLFGCCNGTFWPLFHSMPERAVFNKNIWLAYIRVNWDYAYATLIALRKVIADLNAKGCTDTVPIVWLHNYHMFNVAPTIREAIEREKLKATIGFFLHIPFPPLDIMRVFPWLDELLNGVLACDVVGFQTRDYCMNFLECCHRRLGYRVSHNPMLVCINERTVKVMANPIGIPFQYFIQLAKKAPPTLKSSENMKIILGVDRMDYTKGLIQRIKAYELFLECYPQHLERVQLIQIAVYPRTKVEDITGFKAELDQIIGKVNGRFSTLNWTPIVYINDVISQAQLAGLYRDAAVALVTPLRDGMNMVAKEYVACQIKEPGVLVLSPLAGAAATMLEAVPVNPYSEDLMASTLNKALNMPFEERVQRMKKLRERELLHDTSYWTKTFLQFVMDMDSTVNEFYI